MKIVPFLLAVGIYGSAHADVSNMPRSEEALLAYASTPFHRVDKRVVSLGQLNGTPIIAEFICSDLCPDYTVRIIRYELRKDQTCSAVGGVEKSVRIPVSIAATDKTFCFPQVLVNNWEKYQMHFSYMPSGPGSHE